MMRSFRRRSFAPDWLPSALAAVAVGAGLLSVLLERGERSGVDDPEQRSPLTLVLIGLVVVACLVEAWGVRWPRVLFVAVVALPAAWFVFVGRNASSPMFLVLLVGWLAFAGTRREAILALAAAALAVLIPLPWAAGEPLDWLGWGFGIGFAWLAMLAVGTQQRLLAELRAAQADLARRSALQERQRIAREIHDVVAHSLAITMLHLTGARHVMSRDPARAAEALAQAERLGRQSLADIRRTVGLLGAADDAAPSGTASPLPGAADIAGLVSDYARAGLDVGARIDGEPDRLSPAVGLDLYRIAQEALANAARHAPGARVAVELTVGAREARLRVADDGRRTGAAPIASAGGSGLGLSGMRERAALLGAALAAGRDGAGWLVECVVPLDASAAGVPPGPPAEGEG